MITKICINNVASFKSPAVLETDKKVNLIYGLNGTGKSTLSNFCYNQGDEKFKHSSIEGIDETHDILVYNQTFIQENFHEPENLKGIFTLSVENKEASKIITEAQKEIKKIEADNAEKTKALDAERNLLNQKIEIARNSIWKIKSDYSGGDRVLEFCLDGYKSSKELLFTHLMGVKKAEAKPNKSVDDLKNEIQSITGDNSQKYLEFSNVKFSASAIEQDQIFEKVIIGNENSSVAQLIVKIGNSDWVKMGIAYLPEIDSSENGRCPFCQEKTITKILEDNIKSFFDASYESDISLIRNHMAQYDLAIQLIPSKSAFEENPKFEAFKKDFEIKHAELLGILHQNKKTIESKLQAASIPVQLLNSLEKLSELNRVISDLNTAIAEHNSNIDKKGLVKQNVKTAFWDIMRWEYDQTISSVLIERETSKSKTDILEAEIKECLAKISAFSAIIVAQQKRTVNIEEAIANINSGLIDLGITDFRIKKHKENLYRIVRGENSEKIFRSLSEGEKMIISFLYFLEQCRGKRDASESLRKKIIVIDDPISSLSHIYVFNIGRLIKNEFFGVKNTKDGVTSWNFKYEQIFILTHSLYFFYEITETNHEFRRETQKLVRLAKNENGSTFAPMSYEEIQNDYQAYWYIIKDNNQPPALIANCMRNVIEYFFNFVEKRDLNNFFKQEPLNRNKYQSFYRYINRESHSLGQNIFDFKEFNYADLKEAFAELFKITGYEDHYKKMMK